MTARPPDQPTAGSPDPRAASSFRLASPDGIVSFDLPPGRKYILGRGAASDFAIPDPTISRLHAELQVLEGEVELADLGSSNGTLLNGKRITRARARAFDTITFGRAVFRLEPASSDLPAGHSGADAPAEGTIVRALPVDAGIADPLHQVDQESEESHLKLDVGGETGSRSARKLALLLDLSQRLSGELDIDRLLEAVVANAFDVLAVDRVAILLKDGATGRLVPRVSRSVLGELQSDAVPRSIIERVAVERVALLTDNATADSRFSGRSILVQSVRSAMCTPLMRSAHDVLGVLYVDSVTASNSFSDEDLQFLVAFGGIAAAGIRASYQAEELQRHALVRGNFERYFAPDVAAEIAQNVGAVGVGGERRPIAVLFSDVRGFTRLAEGMPPEALAATLTEYFSLMVDIIFEHGGTLDKFVGDAIMALWGAPRPQADAAERAVRAAAAMQRALQERNPAWEAEGRPRLEVGIGINYGEVFAGNIGSHRRLEYTVLGDVVNVAARLCAEAGAGDILVADGVKDALSAEWTLEELTPSELRGREGRVGRWKVGR